MASERHRHVCLSRTVLADFALGKLPPEDLERIAADVESCRDCQAVLGTLDDVDDSVVHDLKEGFRAGIIQIEPRIEEQIRQAEAVIEQAWQDEDQLADPFPGRLGQYELLEQIGRGGMGAVYKAMHTRLKRLVAVKLLSAHRLQDPQAIARFQQENGGGRPVGPPTPSPSPRCR